jgi:hypothetical protein
MRSIFTLLNDLRSLRHSVLADLGRLEVVQPEMHKSTVLALLGSALLARAAIGLCGRDLARLNMLSEKQAPTGFYYVPSNIYSWKKKKCGYNILF